jgi:hypothetical protein
MAQETITAQDILRQSLDRNRYFYGKLMTVRDFTQEQLYFNAKRWLINRLLFGSGVICGLKVSAGPKPTDMVIDPGVALDPLGREVTVLDIPGSNIVDLTKVIPVPSTPTIDLDGFICLSHRECPKDPVPSLRASPCDEGCESNRWSETFDVSWDEDSNAMVEPSLCQSWLNRTTVAAEDEQANLKIERTTPLWVTANEVFEVVVRVTATNRLAKNITIFEDLTNATLVEPDPSVQESGQFPTPPVNLAAGEFFVYIYQAKAPAVEGGEGGKITVKLKAEGLPALTSTIDVLTDDAAKTAERQFLISRDCRDEPKSTCVRIAKLNAHFKESKLDSFSIEDYAEPRFRYSLEHVTGMLDCLRASFLAEAGSSRPGHAFITFNDLESGVPQLIGTTGKAGSAFTAARGDHVHELLRAANSGLEFDASTNRWRIDGFVGGENINFRKTVKGQTPIEANDLVTKDYVDAHIAGLDWQESVLTKERTTPPPRTDATETTPATPKEGDRYLLFNEPQNWKGSGTAKGKKNDIAIFNGKNWEFVHPDEGTATFVEDENVAYLFVDGKWTAFLAAPQTAAGKGLIADPDKAVFSVGEGEGIVVTDDKVAARFDLNPPKPIGLTASAGSSKTVADGDHVHTLPLSKEGPGLVFDEGLRIEGPVAGTKISFRSQVAGQDPNENQHLATKKYVDDNVASIDAGDGLVRKGKVISVGQGAGIKVNPDDVAVAFETKDPRPVGSLASPGTPGTVSPGDHVHTMLLTENSGLVLELKGLRVGGLVAAQDINFLNPVAGRDPQLNEHLTTKRYVDQKVVPPAPVVAGKGLVSVDHTISVGQGDGILVGEDSVAVRFAKSLPLPDNDKGNPGAALEASRGDHIHPLPAVTPGATSGVVLFTPANLQKRFTVASASINPELGEGAIGVQLAFVDPNAGDTYYCDATNLSSMAKAQGFPDLLQFGLASKIKMGAPTTFQILVDILPRDGQPLPANFQVRWFAYLPRFASGGGQPEPPVGPPTR